MEISSNRCFICNNQHQDFVDITHSLCAEGAQTCPQCGHFEFVGESLIAYTEHTKTENTNLTVNLVGWIHDQNRQGIVPAEITTQILEILKTQPRPLLVKRAERLLSELVRREDCLCSSWIIHRELWVTGATYSKNLDETRLLIDILMRKGWIGFREATTLQEISSHYIGTEGYIAYEGLTPSLAGSDKGFVAMSFDEELKTVYTEGIQPAISSAGYDAIRIDQKEDIGKIDDAIIANINSSRFIVADFTGHKGGVYFEAGYAMGERNSHYMDLPEGRHGNPSFRRSPIQLHRLGKFGRLEKSPQE